MKNKTTNYNRNEANPAQNSLLQYSFSITLGILTILLLSATYYFGIFR